MKNEDLIFKRLTYILRFLNKTGWPEQYHNFDVNLANTLNTYVSNIIKGDEELIPLFGIDGKYTEVSLESQIRSDADGLPVIRDCMEFETLMSFNDDDDNIAFREWWDKKGAYFFNEWLKRNE